MLLGFTDWPGRNIRDITCVLPLGIEQQVDRALEQGCSPVFQSHTHKHASLTLLKLEFHDPSAWDSSLYVIGTSFCRETHGRAVDWQTAIHKIGRLAWFVLLGCSYELVALCHSASKPVLLIWQVAIRLLRECYAITIRTLSMNVY